MSAPTSASGNSSKLTLCASKQRRHADRAVPATGRDEHQVPAGVGKRSRRQLTGLAGADDHDAASVQVAKRLLASIAETDGRLM